MTNNFWCDRYLQLPWHIIQHLPAGLDCDLGRRHNDYCEQLTILLFGVPTLFQSQMVGYEEFYFIEKHRSPTQDRSHMELFSVVLWTQAVNFRRFRSIRYILSGGTDPMMFARGRVGVSCCWRDGQVHGWMELQPQKIYFSRQGKYFLHLSTNVRLNNI